MEIVIIFAALVASVVNMFLTLQERSIVVNSQKGVSKSYIDTIMETVDSRFDEMKKTLSGIKGRITMIDGELRREIAETRVRCGIVKKEKPKV